MTINAAQLMVTIGANPAGAIAGINTVSGMLAKSAPLGMAALGAGAIMAGVGIAATKMAGDFQAGITSLATGAGESTANLDMVSKGILQLAKDTGTSTQQLIDGMYMIESGGFHGAAGLAILKAAAEGAKVGNADLGVVADATDTILKNYGENGALSAAQATNTLIATVANGKTHMQDLAQAIAFVLPTGAAAKVGLDSVMGAMATMTNEGIPAAESATYLRQTIIALMAPSDGAKQALASIGLTSTQVADAMHRSLPEAMQLIHDHLVKKFPEGSASYVAAVREIAGGSRQMQGMLALGGDHLKTFTELTKKVGGAGKTTGDQITGWNLVQKNANLQLSRAKEVAETLFIQLGTKLLPVVTKIAQAFADNIIPALKNFVTWITGSSTSANIIRPILIALAIAIAGALVAAFISWAISAAAAAVATIAATWPILAIGAAIALLIAGIILLVTHWGVVTAALGHFKDAMGDLLGHIGEFFGDLFGKIGQFFGNVFGAIGGFFGNVFGAIGNFVGHWVGTWLNLEAQTVERVKVMVGSLLGHIGQLKDNVINKIHDLVTTVLTRITTLKDNVVNKAKALATDFMGAITGLPAKLLNLGEQLLQKFAQGLRNGRSAVMGAVSNIPIIGGIAGGINKLIPQFATGGVMPNSGVALVGERGPELVQLPVGAQVTPLPGGGMAPLPSSLQGAGQSIQVVAHVTLMADGRKLAEVTVPHMHTVIRNATGARGF